MRVHVMRADLGGCLVGTVAFFFSAMSSGSFMAMGPNRHKWLRFSTAQVLHQIKEKPESAALTLSISLSSFPMWITIQELTIPWIGWGKTHQITSINMLVHFLFTHHSTDRALSGALLSQPKLTHKKIRLRKKHRVKRPHIVSCLSLPIER